MNPDRSFDPIAQARARPSSLRLAINAKCWDCVGGYADPGPRLRIRDCPCAATCTLHPVRPFQTVKGRSADAPEESEAETPE